jgi:hypothetical protein
MSTPKLDIEKLNANNYRDWSFLMMKLLKGKRVWSHVDGSAGARPPSTEGAARIAYDNGVADADLCITMYLEKDQLIHVRDKDTPKAAWDALKERYNKASVSMSARLHQEFWTQRYQPGTPMLDHVNSLKTIFDRLAEIGEPQTEKMLAKALLVSLPPSAGFEALITAVVMMRRAAQQMRWWLLSDTEPVARSDNSRRRTCATTAANRGTSGVNARGAAVLVDHLVAALDGLVAAAEAVDAVVVVVVEVDRGST